MANVAPCSEYVLPLLLTIATEGGLAFVLGIRATADQGKLMPTNVLTNICLNALIIAFAGQMSEYGYALVMVILEAVIVLTEAKMLEALGGHLSMSMQHRVIQDRTANISVDNVIGSYIV